MQRAFPPEIPSSSAATPSFQQGAASPYLKAVRSHPVIVAVVVLAALFGSIAYLGHRTSRYKATADILFTPLPSDNNGANGLPLLRDSSDPTRLAQTAANLLDTPAAAGLTAEALGRGWSSGRVREAVKVEPQGESDIVSVSAEADSAGLAQRLANTYATSSLTSRRTLLRAVATPLRPEAQESTPAGDTVGQERRALIASLIEGQDPNFSLSQSAARPSSPAGTPAWLVVVLSIVAGFALGSGAAVFAEMVSDRIRDPEELLDLYQLPALAYVPQVPRNVRPNANGEAVSVPIAVREAYRMIRVQLDTEPPERETQGAHLILITSASSGDGKTSSSIALATALAEADHRVVLVDLDLRKPDLGSVLHLNGNAGVTSLLDERAELPMALVSGSVPLLRVLPAGPEASEHLLRPVVARMPEMTAQLRELADYVVIDTPPLGEVSDAYQLLPFVDDVIVVARPGNTRRASFQFMRDLLGRAKRTPLGMIIVGSSPARISYAYYGQPEMDDRRMRNWLGRARV